MARRLVPDAPAAVRDQATYRHKRRAGASPRQFSTSAEHLVVSTFSGIMPTAAKK